MVHVFGTEPVILQRTSSNIMYKSETSVTSQRRQEAILDVIILAFPFAVTTFDKQYFWHGS